MLERLRAFVNRVLPWYDERSAALDAAQTSDVIRRSVHQRQRHELLVQKALAATERRRNDRVRDNYRRADARIGR